jgi:hypothetical protein
LIDKLGTVACQTANAHEHAIARCQGGTANKALVVNIEIAKVKGSRSSIAHADVAREVTAVNCGGEVGIALRREDR